MPCPVVDVPVLLILMVVSVGGWFGWWSAGRPGPRAGWGLYWAPCWVRVRGGPGRLGAPGGASGMAPPGAGRARGAGGR
ncbi:hypothetical protein GCM10018785_31050 [Streptomyces longispororuber]|uniref:Uncharacterized protein n=1 Tax=Streptomyces longispororuber TaxID=68230 RepID=A0A919DNC4_9ACTN|nr:hypothetical protein GCM10018785_31050 [Streptomyces longispororuber]